MARTLRTNAYRNEHRSCEKETGFVTALCRPRRRRNIFDTLPNTGEDGDYDTAVAKLNEYFSPQVNTTYEVYNFRQTKQKEGESLDSFHTRLRQLAKTCEFSDVNKEIKEHTILTCSSGSLKRRALRKNPTLEGLLNLGRALELSEKQAKDVEDTGGEFEAVNKIKRKEENRQSRPHDRRDTVTQSSFWKQASQISKKMWQLWRVRISQKSMSCARKNL